MDFRCDGFWFNGDIGTHQVSIVPGSDDLVSRRSADGWYVAGSSKGREPADR